jgi:predicted HicB family RNase H-like nuclease
MEYKGYIARVEFDDGAETFHGRVMHLRDVITFEADSVAGLKREFRTSVDGYLDFCRERGEEPERPFSGKFIVRLDPDLHRAAALAAEREGRSLNRWVAAAIGDAAIPPSPPPPP